MERRSLTGIARERETRADHRAPPISRPGAPVSDRHRAGARNPHRRRRAPPISRPGAPVSDRHRAGARNPHRRRRAPPISRPGAPVSDRHRAGARNPHRRRWPCQSHGQERRSLTGIARERETRTDDAGHANLTARSAGLRPASRGSAKPAPTTLAMPISRLERRSLTGIARERETSADDTAPCQRECRTPSQHRMPRSLTAPPTRGCASLDRSSQDSSQQAPTGATLRRQGQRAATSP